MSLINWIFDFYQHSKIDDARREAAAVRAELASVRGSSGRVDDERLLVALEELALSVRTVQRALIAKGVCSEEDFARMLRTVDGEDGRVDGRSPI